MLYYHVFNFSILYEKVIFPMFVQEHESTTVGLMLGLAASYGGTMHPAISKVLSSTTFR